MSNAWNFFRHNQRYGLFLLSSTISLIGSTIFDIAIPLYVIERSHSAWALSALAVALNLPYFVMAPLTGYVVDRFDKRKIMLASEAGQMVLFLLLLGQGMLVPLGLIPVLGVVFITKTLSNMFDTVATFQLVPALVERQWLPLANSYFLSAQRIAQMVGPFLAGILMGWVGVRTCIILNLVSFLATFAFVYFLSNLDTLLRAHFAVDSIDESLLYSGMLSNFSKSVRFIWRSPLLKPLVLLMFFWNLSSLCPNTPALTYYFTEAKHISERSYGLFIALLGLTGIIGYLLSEWVYTRWGFEKSFVLSAFWQALLATLAVSFLDFPWAFAVLFALSRSFSALLSMGTFVIRQTEIPGVMMGGINATLRMGFMSAAPLSALVQGWLLHSFGTLLPLSLGAGSLWLVYYFSQQLGAAHVQVKSANQRKAA